MLATKRPASLKGDEPTSKERAARAAARREAAAQRQAEAPVARQEYYDAQQAEREKTVRLRALRLARGNAEKEIADPE